MTVNCQNTFHCFLFILASALSLQADSKALSIGADFTGTRVSGPPIWVLEDPESKYSLNEVSKLYSAQKEGRHYSHYNFSLTTSTYWIAVNVRNDDQVKRDLLLEIVNTYLSDFEVYRLQDDGALLGESLKPSDGFHKRGQFLHHSSREHRNFHFTFSLEAQQQTVWIFKFNPIRHPLNFHFFVWDEEYRFNPQRDFEIRLLHGFFMLGIVYLLLLAFAITITRFHYFWFYVVYVTLGLMFVFTDMGQSYRYVWPEHPQWHQVAGPIIANLYLIAGILFFREYFKTREFYPRTDNLLIIIMVAGAGIIPLILTMPGVADVSYAHILFRFANVLYAVTCIIFFSILFSMLFRSQKYFSGLFLFGFSLHGLNIIAANLQSVGIAPGGSMSSLLSGIGYPLTFHTHVTLLLGMLLEMGVVFYIAIRRFADLYTNNTQVLSDLAFQKEQNMNLLVMGVEKERERIARDLHDGLGVLLASVKMKLNLFQENDIEKAAARNKLQEIIGELDNSHQELRNVARNLMPKALYKVGLIAAVEELIHRIRMLDDELDIQFYTNMDFKNTSRLSQLYLFRIVQEILTNLVQHSRAKSAHLQLVRHESLLRLTMEDDGIGFDVSKSMKEGSGLNNIRYRVNALNGKVFFDSKPGAGSLISMEIPLKALEE